MPDHDERWNNRSSSEWDDFARDWIDELRKKSSDGEQKDGGKSVYDAVIAMNFTAAAKPQWSFILAAMKHATDDELGSIACCVEHLLWKHGPEYIGAVEQQAATDPKFARMMKNVRQHMASDDVWRRVCEIQGKS